MKTKYPIGGYAPGNYKNKCCICKTGYIGDKRSVQCEPCVINSVNENNKKDIKDKL